MNRYKNFVNIECKVFNLNNIPEELFNIRERFCTGECRTCTIHINYYRLGLSCNEALNRYPEECKELMIESLLQD